MTDDSLSPTERGDSTTSPARQRAAGRPAKQAGQGDQAGRTLEPVQAVLVQPAGQVIRHRRFLSETQAMLFRLALCWARGPALQERRRLAEARLAAIGNADEQARQRRRLAHAVAIAEALGGPPSHVITPTSEAADVDIVGLFFRRSTATSSYERRRRAAHLLDHLRDEVALEPARALWRRIEALVDGEPDHGRGDDAA